MKPLDLRGHTIVKPEHWLLSSMKFTATLVLVIAVFAVILLWMIVLN